MSIIMQVSMADTDPEDLHEIAFDLMNTVNSETDIVAEIGEQPGKVGDKGESALIGQIIMTAFTSGAVVALFEVIKAYFERKPLMQIELKRPDGEQLMIKTEQVNRDHLDQTIAMASKFIGESGG
jgi:hypothetical protein